MPEHGQELVLGAVGGFSLLPGAVLTFTKFGIASFETLAMRDITRNL